MAHNFIIFAFLNQSCMSFVKLTFDIVADFIIGALIMMGLG